MDAPTGPVDRTFAAVVIDWEGCGLGEGEGESIGAGSRIEALTRRGVDVGIVTDLDGPVVGKQLPERPSGPGRLLTATGAGDVLAASSDGQVPVHHLRPAGKQAVLGWLLGDLWERGIGPGLVLVVGFTPDTADHDRGAPGVVSGADRCTSVPPGGVTLLAILDAQCVRHDDRRVPAIDDDPRWVLAIEDHSSGARVQDALFTIGDGHFGTRGGGFVPSLTQPMVLAAGVYGNGIPGLLPGPVWGEVETGDLDIDRRRHVLDLRSGVVTREFGGGNNRIRTFCFSSVVRAGCMALRAEGPADDLAAGPLLRPPPDLADAAYQSGTTRGRAWAEVEARAGAGIAAVATESVTTSRHQGVVTVERLAAYAADPERPPGCDAAVGLLDEGEGIGFDALLREQREGWAARWADATVSIEGDPTIEFGIRFALFHLLGSVSQTGETAVGARGLSGPAYAGHVFWDADVFVLPVLAAVCPRAARTMLEYRIRRLDAARAQAAARGCAGARFPWESACDGDDVTPRSYVDHDGEVVAIRTGEQEEHIVADVAWAAWQYATWSGDDDFLRGPGRALLVDTARYWASRVQMDASGRAHLLGVIGPDEYHDAVDDNAFTNVMARWNLRRAADLVEGGRPHDATVTEWRRLADALVDGLDADTGRYEQFAGFDELEPVLIAELADPPVAADLLLGRDRVRASQVIKQADVLMLHHLVPDEVAPDSLAPNLVYYLPRTAHGSSLSPAVHASLLARAGRVDEALDLLRLACRVDLDDLTGTTGGGLHLATMGGVWQALVFGFAGVRTDGHVLHLDPRWPATWEAVTVNLQLRGGRITLRFGPDEIDVRTERALRVAVSGGRPIDLTPPGGHLVQRSHRWERKGR